MGKKPARKKGARRLNVTPELLANVRHRYEHTDEPLAPMAADLGCCGETVRAIARREGWVRYEPPPRDLSPAARLRMKAEKLGEQGAASLSLPPRSGGEGRPPELAQQAQADGVGGVESAQEPPTPDPSPPFAARTGGGEKEAAEGEEESAAAALHAAATAQLLHEVDGFLGDVRAERKRMKREGYAKHELQAVSRVIADLSGSLNRLKPLAQRAAEPDSGLAYDDMPADLDEFREQLARRIEAFFAARPDAGDAGRPDADADAAP